MASFKWSLALLFSFGLLVVVLALGDKVLLSDLKAITLQKGMMTRARRSYAVPQMSCVGGSAQSSNYHPTVVQCQNMGSDGHDVQWECKAELDDAVKFGKIEVNCEGYSYPEDPYVLQGSCGLEYTLDYTRKGNNQPYADSGNYRNNDGSNYYYSENRSSSGFGTVIAFFILVGVIFLMLRVCCSPNVNNHAVPSGPAPSAPYMGPGNYGMPGSYPDSSNGSSPPYSSSYSSAPPSSGPGFWSGLTAGGLLGYMFRPRHYGPSYYQPGPSSWFRPSYGGASHAPSMSFGSGGGGSRTSSGFGGTKRR